MTAASPDEPFFWCAPNSRGSRNAGFTLLEVLAAFLVLALLTIALQRGVATAASSMARAQVRAGAEIVLAGLLSGPLVGTSDTAAQSGRLDGYDWTVRVESMPPDRFGGAPSGRTPPSWSPVRLSIEVREAGKGPLLATGEAIRLVPAAR